MATFGRGRLCAPITDDDLRQVDVDPDTGATTVTLLNDFVVSVNGTPTTVTVPLPSDAGLEYGYYTDATAEADSWLLALETAIEAAEGGSWTLAERGGDVCGNVTRYSYTRNGLGVGPVQFQMDNASTTIDPKLLGFDADTYSGSPTVNAPFAAPHCWRPGTISWVSTEPLRNVSQVKSASVKTSNHLTGGTQHREIIPSRNMPIAKVLKSGTVHDTDIAAVPNLANDDPNYPLESLWEVAWDHLPLKWLPVETLPGENVKYLQIDGSQALSDMRTFITKRSTNLRFFDVDLPLIQWEPIGGKEFYIHAVVCTVGPVVELTTLAEGLSQSEGTRVRMVQTADASNNIPAITLETVMVAGGWGPAGAAVGFRDLPSGRWAWGNIDDQVGAPGSTDRLLVYRSSTAAPVTFNANKTIDLTWSSGEATTGYFGSLTFVGIEVNIPIPRIEGSDIVVDNFPASVGTSTLWQTFCGICNPSSIDVSLMSNLGGGSGVGATCGQFNQAAASSTLVENVTVALDTNYNNVPVRLQTQVAQSRHADDGWVVTFIPQSPHTSYDSVTAVSPAAIQTDWIANDWVTFLAITNQTSTDSWSITSQTVLIPEPHFYDFAGGVPS